MSDSDGVLNLEFDRDVEALRRMVDELQARIDVIIADIGNDHFVYDPATNSIYLRLLDAINKVEVSDSFIRFFGSNDGSNVEFLTLDFVNLRAGVNTVTPESLVEIREAAGNTDVRVSTYSDSAAHRPRFQMVKSHDDTPGVLAETQDGDGLGRIMGSGVSSDDTLAAAACQIDFEQDGSAGTDFVPGRIIFKVRDAAGAQSSAVTIKSDGKVGVNTVSPNALLDVESGTIRISGINSEDTDGLYGYNSNGVHIFSLIRQDDVDTGDVVLSAYGGIGLATGEVSGPELGGSYDVYIDDAGNVGVNTTSPSLPLDVKAKCGISDLGGVCIKLTNKTGSNTISGQLIKADTANDDAVVLTAADDVECMGVFLESGTPDGSEAWVVVSGIADVAMADNTAATRGNWVGVSSEAGYADATNATPPAASIHFREVGHCIETVAAGGVGTHVLARCVLHFN